MFRLIILLLLLLAAGCDSNRIYETNHDFANGQWPSADTLNFEISIPDSSLRYSIALNVRNTIDFQTARLFVQYRFFDPTQILRSRLVEQNLFDKKTGEPFGDSGLGNIYTHHFLLESGMKFPKAGMCRIQLNHMMRSDTLNEVLSVGIRVEKIQK
jgi:gliding motility-associated lipoprotein GldH